MLRATSLSGAAQRVASHCSAGLAFGVLTPWGELCCDRGPHLRLRTCTVLGFCARRRSSNQSARQGREERDEGEQRASCGTTSHCMADWRSNTGTTNFGFADCLLLSTQLAPSPEGPARAQHRCECCSTLPSGSAPSGGKHRCCGVRASKASGTGAPKGAKLREQLAPCPLALFHERTSLSQIEHRRWLVPPGIGVRRLGLGRALLPPFVGHSATCTMPVPVSHASCSTSGLWQFATWQSS